MNKNQILLGVFAVIVIGGVAIAVTVANKPVATTQTTTTSNKGIAGIIGGIASSIV